MSEKKLTLEGVMIADLSHALAAPYCSMILADHGADVVRIEPVKGDPFRYSAHGAWNALANRNKRGISLNLKDEKGKEALKKILSKADVLLESFTPGTIERLGFGYDVVSQINPKIIYCSISGFGQTGPYRNQRGFDVVAQAMSGIMLNTGDADRPPVRVGTSAVDMGAGSYLACGILLSLMDRERTGKGQRIEVSLFETALSWMGPYSVEYSISGQMPQRFGSGFGAFCPYRVFEASDGYVFIGCATDKFWQAFCAAFDLKELAANPVYSETKGRLENREELDGLVQKAMAGYKISEIVERLHKAGVPVAPVLNVKETMEDPHAIERDAFASLDHPEYGQIKIPRIPIVRSGKMPEIRKPSPRLGQHTREVLAEVGYSDEQIEELISSGAAIAAK